MAKVELHSKAWLALMYGKSASTIYRWIQILYSRHAEFAEKRNDQRYMCFMDYNTYQKTLTPAQVQLFLYHFGVPDKLQKD